MLILTANNYCRCRSRRKCRKNSNACRARAGICGRFGNGGCIGSIFGSAHGLFIEYDNVFGSVAERQCSLTVAYRYACDKFQCSVVEVEQIRHLAVIHGRNGYGYISFKSKAAVVREGDLCCSFPKRQRQRLPRECWTY